MHLLAPGTHNNKSLLDIWEGLIMWNTLVRLNFREERRLLIYPQLFLRHLKYAVQNDLLILFKAILDFMRFPCSTLPQARSMPEVIKNWHRSAGKQPELVDQKSSCRLLSLPLDSCYLHDPSCNTAAAGKVNLLSGHRGFESSKL